MTRYTFDLRHCWHERRGNQLIVETAPEEANNKQWARKFIRSAYQSGNIELAAKAAGALAMTNTVEEAAAWLEECEEAHIRGDCLLCGAE